MEGGVIIMHLIFWKFPIRDIGVIIIKTLFCDNTYNAYYSWNIIQKSNKYVLYSI